MGAESSKPAFEPGPRVLQSYLHKQSDHLGQWRRRYALLDLDRRTGVPALSFFVDEATATEESPRMRTVLAGADIDRVATRPAPCRGTISSPLQHFTWPRIRRWSASNGSVRFVRRSSDAWGSLAAEAERLAEQSAQDADRALQAEAAAVAARAAGAAVAGTPDLERRLSEAERRALELEREADAQRDRVAEEGDQARRDSARQHVHGHTSDTPSASMLCFRA
eukprot:23701-Prymnesium_polylepis.1